MAIASKSVHSFSKYHVDRFGNRRTKIRTTDGRTNERTGRGQSSLAEAQRMQNEYERSSSVQSYSASVLIE